MVAPTMAMQALRLHAPVWVQSKQQEATALGFEQQLESGQNITTDLQAWAQLGLADASRLVLAGNSQLGVSKYSVGSAPGGAVHIELELGKGQLHFTPSKIGARRQRQILIHAGEFVIHAGDLALWVDVNPLAARFCSEQAGIKYSAASGQLRQTKQPGCVVLANGQLKTRSLSAAKGMQPQRGQQSITGVWTLQLLAAPDLQAAKKFQASLRLAGYAAEIDSQKLKNKIWHRVVLNYFASAKDAEQIATIIGKHWRLEKPWWRKQVD